MARPRLLMTGGTGFLGKHVVPLLEQDFDVDVLSRSAKGLFHADLADWNAGIEDLEPLKDRKYVALLHMAGLYDLMASSKACYLQNVVGTTHALRVAQILEIPVFISTSSVAAAINCTQEKVHPTDLNLSDRFPDAYSESKACTESILQNWSDEVPLRVNLRPGVLVGDSHYGLIERIDGPYYAPQAFQRLRGLIESFPAPLPLPGSESVRLPILPVDICAKAVVGMTKWAISSGEKGYRSFHLTPQIGVALADFYQSTLRHLFLKNRGIRLMTRVPDAVMKKLSKWAVRFPEEQTHYLLKFPFYDSSATQDILGPDWCPEFESYEFHFWSGYEKFVSNR